MDKYEVLHMFRICFLAFLSAEDGSAEEDIYQQRTVLEVAF